jgi:DNA-binding response OmpR family regulator
MEALKASPPDLISLDLEIPERTADDTAIPDAQNAVRLMERVQDDFPWIRVAVLTGIEWRSDVMLELLRRGVRLDDYISKDWPDALDRLGRSLVRLWLEAQRNATLVEAPEDFRLFEVQLFPDDIVVDDTALAISAGTQPYVLMDVLAQSPNAPVPREELVAALWPPTEEFPDDAETALNGIVRRVRATAKRKLDNPQGDRLIGSSGGVYWLQAIIR